MIQGDNGYPMFDGFLDSDDQYKACQQYWANLVDDIASTHRQSGEWQRWILGYADGTPFERDGNPIYDGRSSRLERAFRIIQHPPEGSGVELGAWMGEYGVQYTELPRAELVINLALSRESSALARELLMKWMAPATTVDEMRTLIDQTYALLDSSSE